MDNIIEAQTKTRLAIKSESNGPKLIANEFYSFNINDIYS